MMKERLHRLKSRSRDKNPARGWRLARVKDVSVETVEQSKDSESELKGEEEARVLLFLRQL